MKINMTPLAAAICALSMFAGAASAASPLMGAPVSVNAQAATELVARLTAQRALHGLDADHNFTVAAEHPGVEGTRVARAHHTYKGVRIFGSESVVVLNAAGQILSESVSDRRLYLGKGPANKLGAATAAFSVKPAVGAPAAIATAVRAAAPKGKAIVAPAAELIIYPFVKMQRLPAALSKPEAELNALDVEDVVTGYELAWLVRTRMLVGERPLYHDTVVSARTGRILASWDMLQTATGVGNSQYNGTVPLSTTQSGDTFRMVDPQRGTKGTFGGLAVTNANHGTSAGEVYAHWANTWGDGKQFVEGGSTTGANGQTAAVNAMWGLMNTYDMFKNTLGWQSLDGQNTATYIAVHVNRAYDNAYYSDTCKCMFIGDGSSFTNLGSLDVVGHEMGHGVTAATSNLLYFGESGGLNESASDISGEMVEAYARAGGTGAEIPGKGNDWMMGTEISKSGTPLRWMARPSRDGSSHDAWSTALRRLDVHYSSGPNNRMFYFLAQGSNADKGSDQYSKYLVKEPLAMTGIGSDKAYRIWFKALTTKFTAVTNYADARNKMLASAQELYGMDSREAVAVQRAYAAINVGSDVSEPRP
jgi:Zn-dependent metalloprotease